MKKKILPFAWLVAVILFLLLIFSRCGKSEKTPTGYWIKVHHRYVDDWRYDNGPERICADAYFNEKIINVWEADCNQFNADSVRLVLIAKAKDYLEWLKYHTRDSIIEVK